MTYEELMALNARLLERHEGLRVFQMFGDGTLDDPAKREVFFACLQALARTLQTIAFAPQASSADELWDPVLEGTCAWFLSRMTVLDDIEKLVVVNLVIESSGAYMGDHSHVTLAEAPLRGESPAVLARLAVVIEQAWRMLDTHAERVATLVEAAGHG